MQREDVTLAGAGTPFHMAYLAAQREQPDDAAVPERAGLPRRRRAEAAAAALRPQGGDRRRRHRVGLRPHRGADPHDGDASHDPDEKLAEHRGPRHARRRAPHRRRSTGKAAGIGEEGEIRAKAPAADAGLPRPSLDADAFDEDGWFRTGDLGTLDADGNVTITGRLKDIIIRKGENISAKEVEDLLFTHPKVADVAVIGLPDPKPGERACAVVVPTDAGRPARRSTRWSTFLQRAGAHDAEDPRAARDRRRAAPQPDRQGPEARAARAVLEGIRWRFAGKVAIVTGAGAGIGRATARRLGGEGAPWRASTSPATRRADGAETSTAGGKATACACDVGDSRR